MDYVLLMDSARVETIFKIIMKIDNIWCSSEILTIH